MIHFKLLKKLFPALGLHHFTKNLHYASSPEPIQKKHLFFSVLLIKPHGFFRGLVVNWAENSRKVAY